MENLTRAHHFEEVGEAEHSGIEAVLQFGPGIGDGVRVTSSAGFRIQVRPLRK